MESLKFMSESAKFESRIGVVKVGGDVIYRFITDMRNFKRFIPGDTVKNWKATVDKCSFEVSPVGNANLKITDSEEFTVVKYSGDGLNGTDFYLWVQIKEVSSDDTRVKLTIKADLNPMIKMMAQKPINDFLEKLVKGVEEFDSWESTAG
jgi:carbon monoxide dehydrogenase subunit G